MTRWRDQLHRHEALKDSGRATYRGGGRPMRGAEGVAFRRCQWIAGEPTRDESCKCGAPAIPGSPYCEAHHRRAYLPRAETKATPCCRN